MTPTAPLSLPIEVALQQAIAHHQAGRLQEAEQLYRAILQVQPNQADANHNLGVLAGQIGHHAAGLPHLKSALVCDPTRQQYLLSYANALSASGQAKEALDTLQVGILQGMQSAELYGNLGNVLRELRRFDEAVTSFHHALRLQPNDANAHYNLGSALQDLGQTHDATASYRQAISRRPDFPEAHNNLGICLRELGQLDAALVSFTHATTLNREFAEAHYNLGNALRDVGRLDEAVASYRASLKIKPESAATHGNLANVLRDLGRLDEAAVAYEAAIALQPDFIDAHYELSALKTYRDGDPHPAMLEQQLERAAALPTDTRTHYWFALGKMREDLGRYDASFLAYQEGNRLQHALLPWDDDAEDGLLERMRSMFSKDFFDAHPRPSHAGKSPIFIVGMPRSGTSLLEQILATYPGIYGAGELTDMSDVVTAVMPGADFKHFPDAVKDLSMNDFERMGEQYTKRIWQHAPHASHIIDKMPANFYYIGMIHLMLPHAKIVHAMRDPMDSCFSCYSRLFGQGKLGFAYDLQTLGRYTVRYFKMMQHWHTVLPAGTILDLRYEDMVADTEGQGRRLLEYIGLPWDDRCLAFHQNRRRVATASAAQVRRPIYRSSLARWERYANHLAPLLDLVKDYR